MSYTTGKVRTWSRVSDNDGIVFNNEYDRAYANIREMMDGLAKSADYTIQAADEVGLIRATNAVTKETTKAFSAATPSVVSDVGHGLVTGDTIVVSGSTVESEIGNIHYTVTKITNDTFSLDNTVNAAGGGGNLDWRKDITITLPAATDTDNIYTIMKVDANEGAVHVTDGTADYYLYSQGDWVQVKADGTNWIEIFRKVTELIASTVKVAREYTITTSGLDIGSRVDAAGAAAFATILIPELPQNTMEILVYLNLTDATGATTIGVDFSLGAGGNEQFVLLTATPTGGILSLKGHHWIKTVETAGQGNTIKAKKSTATTNVVNARILGFKTKEE